VSLAFYIVSVYIAAMPTWITIRTFIAVFFALFGLRLIASLDEMRATFGALIAALGITFLWRLWVAMRTGQ
jgi:hypothetical protein